MRSADMFADVLRSPLLAVLCCASVMGCSSVFDTRAEPTPAPASASTSASAAQASKDSSPAASAPKPSEPEQAAVPAAAQRAFDDARRAMRAGRVQDAERGFKSVLQFHPELGGPHANLGVIYRQAGKLPEAVAELELAVKASPRQAVYFNQLGITYRVQGQFAKAREAYERAIDIDASYAAPVLNLGVLYDLYFWDGTRARELYDRYLAMTPGGDATVTKWVADLKNRKTAQAAATTATTAAPPPKEKE